MLAEYLNGLGHSIVGIGRDFKESEIQGLDRKIAIDLDKNSYSLNDLTVMLGKLDALVVTAGTGYAHPIWDIDLAKISEMANANFILPAWIVSVAIHVTNHLILTGSIAGVKPWEGSSVYAGTKAGVIAFADSARKELSRHFIQTINFNNIDRVGREKVLKTYEFMINNPCNMDVIMNI
jgi:NADP-dependent 3-hydroxy acid dehydrogenase YdfG